MGIHHTDLTMPSTVALCGCQSGLKGFLGIFLVLFLHYNRGVFGTGVFILHGKHFNITCR